MDAAFRAQLTRLVDRHDALLRRPNVPDDTWYNGVCERFVNPVVTAEHVPLFWKYDLNPASNPLLLERLGVNVAFNPGAILLDGKVYLMVRVEGLDRKSFFAVAESQSGLDHFRFWDYPVLLDETDDPDTNVYDMRLVAHEDGWIYGLFCSERKDRSAPPGDTSSAVAACGIAKTKDLKTWTRLPDLVSKSAQQRNVVVHPEFINGKYALYTRPQDSFIEAGKGGGIGFALCDSMDRAVIDAEPVMEPRVYHTIKEMKNGQGPAPLKTPSGWVHIAHGVRNTAAGLRYVLYAFMSDLQDPSKVTHRPGGYLLAPEGAERVGDVSNVLFCNAAIQKPDGTVLIYYASSDTRCHVARTSIDRLVDYCMNTPEDGFRSRACVETRCKLIDKNLKLMGSSSDPLMQRARAGSAG